ncbi:hypothetical protein L596_009277 [Steinernema carpocapsae]|uniref:Uncharacterized protein n=1 Tax=Steinernema carpocapsae TaxID=34508 RepID=A0A4U5PF25_STECR|nr:hypothetical protein L596_009277 [Steinernema carpocapsae]
MRGGKSGKWGLRSRFKKREGRLSRAAAHLVVVGVQDFQSSLPVTSYWSAMAMSKCSKIRCVCTYVGRRTGTNTTGRSAPGFPQVFHASLDCAPRRLNALGVDAVTWIHEMLRVVHPLVAVSPPHAADTYTSVTDDDTTIRYMLTYQVQEGV